MLQVLYAIVEEIVNYLFINSVYIISQISVKSSRIVRRNVKEDNAKKSDLERNLRRNNISRCDRTCLA